MTNINLDLSDCLFEANGYQYKIQAGHLITTHLENGGIQWDWQVRMRLKKSDVIPSDKPTSLRYPDGSFFVGTRVIARGHENGLNTFTLVPYFGG